MKKISIVLIISIISLFSCKQKKKEMPKENTSITKETISAVENLCFLKVISRDSIILNIIKKGDSISGEFKWLPYEKDKKRSIFKGILSGNIANTIGEYQAEGMEYEEELIFTIDENTASVKFGEMTEAENGVWKYKDIAKTSLQVLDKVACR